MPKKYRETELFLGQARQRLTQKEQQYLTQWFETGLRDAFARDARRMVEDLINDRQIIPDDTSYVGTMGDCRESGEQLRAEALRRGLALAQTVIFLGDGAAWIWENARLFFPSSLSDLESAGCSDPPLLNTSM